MAQTIALLHYTAPPVIGGVESTLAAHARLLRAHRYHVKTLAGRGESADLLLPEADSRHERVQAVQTALNEGVVTDEFRALTAELTRTLESALADCDLCIAHNIATLHKNLALTTSLHTLVSTRRVRLIAWCHDFAWDDPVYAGQLHPGLPWNLLRTRWDNTKYVVVSAARRADLARLTGLSESEIEVVPPGIDPLEFFAVSAPVRCWVHDLKLLDGAPLLLLPARVTRRKNIELAIDIVTALRERGLRPKLIVMGPLGPHNPANRAYLDELKTRRVQAGLSEDVIFLQEYGIVDDAARRDLYALADALLFPSTREGFGIPVLEAGLARLPIFCADIPVFRESANDNAVFFPLEDSPTDIAGRIADFLLNDSRYALKHRVLTAYSWERIFEEHIERLLRDEPIL